MDAVVSGHAGVALLIEGSSLYSMFYGGEGVLLPRKSSEISLLFAGAGDLRFYEDVNPDQVQEQLDTHSARIDALHLALICLDSELSDETRGSAAEELEEELRKDGVVAWLESVVYARPLPSGEYLVDLKPLSAFR